jgi:hypothetical protein
MDGSSSGDASHLLSLTEDNLFTIASFLGPRDLLDFCASCRQLSRTPTDALWHAFCARAWEAKPRFRLTPQRAAQLDATMPLGAHGWRARYRAVRDELRRTLITQAELQELKWHFNFTAVAGGRGRRTLARARFTENALFVPNYPPLAYSLQTPVGARATLAAPAGGARSRVARVLSNVGGLVGSLVGALGGPEGADEEEGEASPEAARQHVLIANFPPHWVRRLENGVSCCASRSLTRVARAVVAPPP